MRFWKYQGIGNDFVLLDGWQGDIKVDPAWCVKVCDRHFGVGADGVLYVLPGEQGTDVTMRIINADGTEPEMCGNGIRCVAKHVRDSGYVKSDDFSIMTKRGILKAHTVRSAAGFTETVRIDMGAPVLEGRKIPIFQAGEFINQPFEIDGVSLRGNAVSMGNPHFVTFDDLDKDTVRRLGPLIEKADFFPRRTNVEFARVKDGKIDITVYERGAAWTLACGTGACATTTAAALNGLVPFDTPVDVHLPGGWLKVTVERNLHGVLMEGPAKMVFTGETEF